jgi:hypothetical protein
LTVVLRPLGRGNWTPCTLYIEGDRIGPLLVRVGMRWEIAGVVFRISEIRA